MWTRVLELQVIMPELVCLKAENGDCLDFELEIGDFEVVFGSFWMVFGDFCGFCVFEGVFGEFSVELGDSDGKHGSSELEYMDFDDVGDFGVFDNFEPFCSISEE